MNPHTHSPLIRTFRARDARAALGAVKAAFGSDAVIIETRQVGGGLFGRAQIEVTAAAANNHDAGNREGGKYDGASRDGDGLGARDRDAHRNRDRGRGEGGGRDSQMESDIAALRRVMDDVRRTLHRSGGAGGREQGGAGDDDAGYTAEARRVFRHLIDRGLETDRARALVDEALATGAERATEVFAAIAIEVGKRMLAAPAPWSADGRRTVALVGPTGVGKTTAIAKIAARALLETRFKIGLITVDTYRVGASDQLARYGKIMGVPTYVARDRAALASAIEHTRDADLVLIDTAGRSDDESISAQIALVKNAPNVQLQLVLSTAAGAREMGAVAARYKQYGPERLIFTKLDEAEGPAGAIAAAAALARPVSCLCDGQRVPEDIHPVTESTLIERFLAPPAAFLTSRGYASASIQGEQVRGSSR